MVFLWIVVYLSGMLFCKICGEKETNQMWKHLIGFFFLFFCQGVVFFGGQLLGWGFRQTGTALTIFLIFVCALSALICRKELKEQKQRISLRDWKKDQRIRYWGLCFWIFLGLVLVVTFSVSGNRSDAVVETVQTTLMTDTMYQYHPFTKEKLELGVITSRKIITLPFWYALLSLWTGLDAAETVWILGTLLTMICSLLAFGELGGLLFFRNFKKTWLLLLFMELMYLSGDYYTGAAGYRQLFYGYSGEVIVATAVLPAVYCILYRFFGRFLRKDFPEKQEHICLWGLILELGLCLGCTVFLTTFAWGLLMIFMGAGLFLISILGVWLTKRKKQKGVESV